MAESQEDDHVFRVQDDDNESEELLRIPSDAPEDVQWVATCAGHIATIQNHPLGPTPDEYENLIPTRMARAISWLARARGADQDACEVAEDRIHGDGNYSGWGGYCGGGINAIKIATAYVKAYRAARKEDDTDAD